MRLLAGLLLAFAVAAGLGLWITRFTVDRPLGVVSLKVGPWTADTDAGSLRADPYARAIIAKTGEAPIPSSDGLALLARTDSTGAPLDGRCDYSVEGELPGARLWTLSIYDADGFPAGNIADRYDISSEGIVRPAGAPASVTLAATARAGNWLPIPDRSPFVVMLRLYEPAGTIESGAPPTLPVLRRLVCR